MNANESDRFDEQRAAALLGLTTKELHQLSRLSGFGHAERSGKLVFTLDELRRICFLAAASND